MVIGSNNGTTKHAPHSAQKRSWDLLRMDDLRMEQCFHRRLYQNVTTTNCVLGSRNKPSVSVQYQNFLNYRYYWKRAGYLFICEELTRPDYISDRYRPEHTKFGNLDCSYRKRHREEFKFQVSILTYFDPILHV